MVCIYGLTNLIQYYPTIWYVNILIEIPIGLLVKVASCLISLKKYHWQKLSPIWEWEFNKHYSFCNPPPSWLSPKHHFPQCTDFKELHLSQVSFYAFHFNYISYIELIMSMQHTLDGSFCKKNYLPPLNRTPLRLVKEWLNTNLASNCCTKIMQFSISILCLSHKQCDQKMSIKVAQNDFTRKMIHSDTFTKIA